MPNENDFYKKYESLIKRLQDIFGSENIRYQSFFWGKEFAIAYRVNGEGHAFFPEKEIVGNKHFSLDELENKEEIIENLISRWKKFQESTEQ